MNTGLRKSLREETVLKTRVRFFADDSTLIPIVQERDALGGTLTKLYDQIGLDPTKPPSPTLAQYMAATTKAMV